jgi:serine/threonine protein kinase
MTFVCTRCKRDVDTPGLFCPFCGAPAPQPDAEPSDPYIGKTIAEKYFVNGLLGRGGMGQVYKATHLTLDRPVALKMLARSFLSDPDMVKRFHREARAASKLNHPNCINILDFGQAEDGTLFIAMEFLAGRSLEKVLADEFPLGEARVVRIVGQILGALAEAHAAGIIHRDLKLANVMVEARRDEPDFVKVLDFGIAKISEAAGGGQLTGTGIVCGTPGYMSPEQARGEELDARSDLYAVGVILYELLSGRLPFVSNTPMGFVAKHMTEAPRPLGEACPDQRISPTLDAIVMRVLSKAREDRPASAEELRELLYSCELSSVEPRSEPGERGSATVVLSAVTAPRRPSKAGPISGAGVARRAEDTGRRANPSTPAPRTPSPRSPAPREGSSRALRIGVVAMAVVLLGILAYALLRADPLASQRAASDAAAPTPTAEGPRLVKGEPRALAAQPPPAPPVAAVQAVPPEPPPPSQPSPEAAAPVVAPPRPAPLTAPEPAARRKGGSAVQKGAGVVELAEGMNVLAVPSPLTGQGILTVTANPWATVFIDGRELGESPREARVHAGAYRVRVVHPTLGQREAWVTVAAGRRRLFNANLSR